MTHVTISGNIGSGKSTLVGKLMEKMMGVRDVLFVPEPVADWKVQLENFYAGKPNSAFLLQKQIFKVSGGGEGY